MGKFEKEAREMLEAIGGKDNIAAVTHCATRMRFVVNHSYLRYRLEVGASWVLC